MPEIKHTFHAGKMDKDVDERLVKNGEYRDALNIQVRTTDGDSDGLGDAGTVQNIKGNKRRGPGFTKTISYVDHNESGEKDETRIIASIADEANDRAFFFAAAPVTTDIEPIISINPTIITAAGLDDDGNVVSGKSERIWVDGIFELNYSMEVDYDYKPIFVDRFAVTSTYADAINAPSTSTDYAYITVTDGTKYRVGMMVYAQKTDGTHLLTHTVTLPDESIATDIGVEIIKIVDNDIVLAEEQTSNLSANCATIKFVHPERVLEFDYYKQGIAVWNKTHNVVTGINILDDLLFWSDGIHEPKKINIERSKKGTINDQTHTNLWVSDPLSGDLVIITSVETLDVADVKREHITVIRKAPKSPPSLQMAISDRSSDTTFDIDYNFVQDNSSPSIPIEGCTRVVPFPDGIDVRIDDTFKFIANNLFSNEPSIVRGKVITEPDGLNITLKLIFVSDEVGTDDPLDWKVELEQRKPLFETKFGRFAYRYQYDDNEYSSFSPWSELAFLPGEFEYTPSKGYNKGMVNNVRSLVIKDFIPNDIIRPSDVKSIDLLWKTTDNANVYVVKTITRERDSEWENFDGDEIADNTGSMTITSEMIHKVLPANQTLRGWDNVPRNAVAQEMTANRLIYGNYIQGYDINTAFGLKQSVISNPVQFPNPIKSVKSIRNYKFGAVFGDKYGRETPVIANGYKQDINGISETVSGDLVVEKSLSAYSNKFKLEQSWQTPAPADWMYYIKYFVKETSNEYYNLIMDRWYDAEDGNVWVAFPSVDRNKIDEESFLILKNGHGSQKPITEEARYKVIAIENDAPDFIKTVNQDYDIIYITRDNVYNDTIGNVTDAIPDSLIGERTIKIEPSDWSAVAPDTKDFKGIAKARIVGRFNSPTDGYVQAESPWKNLTKIINEGTEEEPGNKGVVLLSGFEAGEVNMYQKLIPKLSTPTELTSNTATVDNQGATGYIEYYIQLRDAVVENKPQYDGRFFVKLEKDETLEATVLGNQISYEVQAEYDIAYIAAKQENEANTEALNKGTYNDITSDATANDWPGNVFTMTEIEYDSTDSNTYELVSSINDSDDLTSAEGIETVSLFGPGDHSSNGNKTEQFWDWWYGQGINGNTARNTNIFMDSTPAYSSFSKVIALADEDGTATPRQVLQFLNLGYQPISHYIENNIYGPSPDGATYPNEPYDFEWDTVGETSAQNWLPRGLSNGSLSNGELGQFTFSVIKDDWNTAPEDSLFKTAMTTPGTIFRFAKDPTNNYKIKSFTQQTENESGFEGFGPFSNGQEISIESKNFADTNNDLHKRYSIITRFVRLDAGNQEISGTGIDKSIWDPRGEVRHDGIGSLKIQILVPVGYSVLSDNSLSTNAACWETEPKEDVGLDIYYEASEAVPVILKDKGDLITFTKPATDRKRASNFTVDDRVISDSFTERVALPASAYISEVIGNDAIKLKHQIYEDGIPTYAVDLTANEPNGLIASRTGIGVAIGDTVNFIHKAYPRGSGMVTKSKIIDHYATPTVTLPGDAQIPVLSSRVTRTATPIGGYSGDQYMTGSGIQNSIEGNSIIGAEILGPGVPPATFVTDTISILEGPAIRVSRKIAGANIGVAGSYTFKIITGWHKIDTNVYNYPIELGWFNCYSFGNGVESDRIRDDFNAPAIDNGIKVSSTFLEYGEEKMGSGLIYSGLYNSTSGVNNLNEFNMAEKITKNLNPIYGSIQALKTSERNLTVFAEDKVLKVLANKDAIYNADGNPQLTATNRVLGDATPYAGDYGISKNPESLASDQYRMYFTDKQRGAVLRLSRDGLTPISDVGMRTYFREHTKKCNNMIGSFDTVNGEYNLTLDTGLKWQNDDILPITISFNERAKAWISFKSFVPSTGVSVNGRYLTANANTVWEHYSDSAYRNNFYGTQYKSEIEVLFNDSPSTIKSFKTINYEGSQSKIEAYTGSTESYGAFADDLTVSVNDDEYYNLTSKNGWYVDSFNTDLQEGTVPEFINKENKWFNKINGVATTPTNLDTNEFSVQGIGFPLAVTSTPPEDANLYISDTFDGLTTLYGDDDL